MYKEVFAIEQPVNQGKVGKYNKGSAKDCASGKLGLTD